MPWVINNNYLIGGQLKYSRYKEENSHTFKLKTN